MWEGGSNWSGMPPPPIPKGSGGRKKRAEEATPIQTTATPTQTTANAEASFGAMQKRAVAALREAAAVDKAARRGAGGDGKAQRMTEVITHYAQALELLRGVVSSPDCSVAVKSKMEEKMAEVAARCEKLEEELSYSPEFDALQKSAVQALQAAATADKARQGASTEDKAQLTAV